MFHRARQAIEAYLTIVFTVLILSREVGPTDAGDPQRHAPAAAAAALSTIAINGATQTFPPAISAERQAVIDAMHGRVLTH